MIKKIYIFFLLIVMTSSMFATVYEYDYSFTQTQFKQIDGHMLVDIPGCMQIGVEGEPLLPNYPVKILLPPGETLETVELVVNKSNKYPLMLPLLPKQADRPLSWGISEGGFIKNEEAYSLDKYVTKNINVDVQWFRGSGIVTGTIDPISYFPLSGNIELAESMTLKLKTRTIGSTPKLSHAHNKFLKNMLQNPEILLQYSINSQEESEHLLIITSTDFKPAFDTLKTHYLKYGIITQVIDSADIELSEVSGRDWQEKARNYIRNVYLEEGLDYVLIGGNSNIIPHRGLMCQVWSGGRWLSSGNIPADLYYAALDGNWDANLNGIFGEYNDTTGFDEADLFPEVAIGRMPISTLEELNNMISKSIRYQAEPVVDDINKHLFLGEFLYPDPESWASDYLELLIGEHDDNGYTTQGLPIGINIIKWYDHDSTDTWDQGTFKQELAEGRSFVHHDGHANYTRLMKFSTDQINDSDFTAVNGIDHVNPIIFSHGCNCGGFDYPGNIGSRLVNSPVLAVGVVFNSRYGWFNEGQTEGPAIHLHREFENAIYGLNFNEFGLALTVAKIATAPWVTAMGQHEQNALRWNFYTLNILGDPVMRIFSDTPYMAQVNWDISDLGESQLKASVSSASDPVENAGIAVMDTSGVLIGFGRTNISGYVEITLSSPVLPGDSIICYVSGENILLAETTLVALEVTIDEPENYFLLESYPNPFNPDATIAYSLPFNSETDIRIFDLQGKLVEVLYQGYQTAGSHELLFHAEDLAAGVYICRLQSADQTKTQKLILLK
ncbi:MAG: C25 family cysteine peptidase [Candidatus Marinimicrobia bacterium]|nr:C25 family cysteine peptidase [Candidatus Neomarinimicrobiota bacterium]